MRSLPGKSGGGILVSDVHNLWELCRRVCTLDSGG